MQKPAIKLALCIPSQGMWFANFGLSLTQMCVHIAATLFEPDQDRHVIVIDKRTSMLPRSRQESLEDALHQECTHALFVDTDQTFPADLAHRLLHWKKPVVACNIPLKTIPSFPTARARGATPFGVPVTSDGTKLGIEKVWRVGMGVMMIDLSILSRVAKPWFGIHYDESTQQCVGEDWFFCERLEKAGIDIYIDHGVSRQVGHVGQFTYTHAHIPVAEEARAA